MHRSIIDVKTGRDYTDLMPKGSQSHQTNIVSEEFIFSEFTLPKSLADGMSVPSTTWHILGMATQLEFGKTRYRHDGGAWQYRNMTNGCFGLGSANENAIDWQWFEEDMQGQMNNLVLHFSPKKMEQVALEVFDMDSACIEMPHQMGNKDPLITSLLLSLRDQMNQNGTLCSLYQQSAMQMLSVHLLSQHCTVQRQLKEVTGKLLPVVYQRVDDYIEVHFNESINLDKLADLANLSVYHFSRLFKTTTGFSPRQYIIKKRLEKAKSLLAKTYLTVEQIAYIVGYDNVSHFSRLFKKYESYTPSQYRKLTRY